MTVRHKLEVYVREFIACLTASSRGLAVLAHQRKCLPLRTFSDEKVRPAGTLRRNYPRIFDLICQ